MSSEFESDDVSDHRQTRRILYEHQRRAPELRRRKHDPSMEEYAKISDVYNKMLADDNVSAISAPRSHHNYLSTNRAYHHNNTISEMRSRSEMRASSAQSYRNHNYDQYSSLNE